MKKSILLLLVFITAAAAGCGLGQKPAADSGGTPPSGAAPETYRILGESNRLTPRQVEDMRRWRADIARFAAGYPGRVFINGPTSAKKVSLTFDDGPDTENTARIIDILDQCQVRGSFFFKGIRLEERSDVVKKADQKGHLVLSHAWSHPQLIKQSPRQVASELRMTEEKLYEIIGKRPSLVRPPFGDIDAAVAEVIAQNGDAAVIWSIDTLDWSQPEPVNIAKNVLDNVRPGDIILMHSDEGKAATVEALPTIITELRKRGYQMVDLGELLGVKPYKQPIER